MAVMDFNGGYYQFTYRMEAKDGSFGFDFGGVFDVVMPNKQLAYTMGDGRKASTLFKKKGNQALVSTTFDAENENPPEFQQQGWQAILNNFKNYAEKTVFNQNHLKK